MNSFLAVHGGFFDWLFYDSGAFLKLSKILFLVILVLLVRYLWLQIQVKSLDVKRARRMIDKDTSE